MTDWTKFLIDIPEDIKEAKESAEVLRVFVADNKLIVLVRPTVFDQVEQWGIALADVTRHIADAINKLDGKDVKETEDRIIEFILREMKYKTDNLKGYFLVRGS